MKNLEQDQDARELALPPSVQATLGELVNAAKDGLLALASASAWACSPR